ncbi:hypothetical protein [Rhodococcus qingshengii]|uniref:hypothetical protein n=1 Tax=Rhodococcus qingshengii TaxID=334542 RepID=UPI00287FA6AB|nr:hypothetical protein [Rhodococcus qingshengii]
MSTIKNAEDLMVGDVFTPPAEWLGGHTFTVITLDRPHKAHHDGADNYDVERDTINMLVSRDGANYTVWLWPDQPVTIEGD